MSEAFEQQFVSFQATETAEKRGFWLDQPWIEEVRRPELVAAPILAVPTVRGAEEGPIFPHGTGEFLERLRELVGEETSIAVAIRAEDYEELALHGKAWRLPTLFVSAVAVPMVVNIFSNRLDELLPGHHAGDVAEATLIIEAPNHRSLKVTYKGDPKEIGAFLSATVPKYIEKLESAPPGKEKTTAHQRHHKAHTSHRGG